MSQAMKGSGTNQKEKGAMGVSKSNKPVWGNVKPGQASVRTDVRVQNDFPTAAEVAQGLSHSLSFSNHRSQSATGAIARSRAQELEAIAQAEKKQAMMQQADAFRGVHLDPNAHHWDEVCVTFLFSVTV
jgi:serine/arginine repetitive matrix protein 2